MDENYELQDSTTPEAGTEQSEQITAPDQGEPESVSYNEFKKVYARAKEAEKKLKELGMREEMPVQQQSTSKNAPSWDDFQKLEAKTLGYSDDEVSFAANYAKGAGVTLSDALKQDAVKAGIESLRQTNKSHQATPPPSKAVPLTPSTGSMTTGQMYREGNDAGLRQSWQQALEKRKRGG